MTSFRIRRGLAGLALACSLALAVSAGCSAGPQPGPPVTAERQALTEGTERALSAGSTRLTGMMSFLERSHGFDGVLSWSNGMIGEVTVGEGARSERIRFTAGAMYGAIQPEKQAAMPGKRWIKRSFADSSGVAVSDFVIALLRMVLHQTHPVRKAAMLAQAGDLRVVGAEQRNGVAVTHYAGTVEAGKLVADSRLGLTDQVVAELHEQFRGIPSEQVDAWLDERGFPVRVESRTNADKELRVAVSADYRDYGAPVRIDLPPENEVIDAREADKLPPR